MLLSAKSHAVVNETVGTLVEWAIEILLLLNEVHLKCPINHNIEPPWGDLGNFPSKTQVSLGVIQSYYVSIIRWDPGGIEIDARVSGHSWVIAHINIYSHSYHCITR